MAEIVYHCERNIHSLRGARSGLEKLLRGRQIASLLDVGSGRGTWLAAARELGIEDIAGIDGVAVDASELHIDPSVVRIFDLTKPVFLGRRFDLVLCLEVAEHLDSSSAEALIETLCSHGNLVFFSAAAPGQHGEHHVNCRWPSYWQGLFNAAGYVCNDDLREYIWDDSEIEPWYRQNLFSAHSDPELAGTEPRIRALIHPEMTRHMDFADSPLARKQFNLSEGVYSPYHYMRLFGRSIRRRITQGAAST